MGTWGYRIVGRGWGLAWGERKIVVTWCRIYDFNNNNNNSPILYAHIDIYHDVRLETLVLDPDNPHKHPLPNPPLPTPPLHKLRSKMGAGRYDPLFPKLLLSDP